MAPIQAASGGDVPQSAPSAFAGAAGACARRRAVDDASTALGPASTWPPHLAAVVDACLASPLPTLLCWGTAPAIVDNAACDVLFGDAPRAATPDAWPELWPVLGPLVDAVRASGDAEIVADVPLSVRRDGVVYEACATLALSAVHGDDGRVDGVLCTCIDGTAAAVARRRLDALHALAIGAAGTRSIDAACRKSAEALGRCPRDVPFAAIYLRDAVAARLALAATAGLGFRHPLPASIGDDERDGLPAQIAAGLRVARVLDLVALGTELPGGAWPERARAAIAVPIGTADRADAIGVLIVGTSPRSVPDDAYATFVRQVAAQIGATIGEAQAYESERRRVKTLAELDRAKTTFFSNVSHEFRTPLTLLLAPLEEALAALPSPSASPQRALLETAHGNAQRLLKLVNALLDFARLEAGRVRARFRPTDLAAATVELASVFRAAIERADLAFDVRCEPLPHVVWVDREMWEKIVLNLLSNALKFTFKGRIEVDLRVVDGKAQLEVVDSGIGIAAEELSRLFQRFHRIDGVRARSNEGSGIGLALVAELVQMHGGEVAVDSMPGTGSRFRVTLPFGNAHLPTGRLDEAPRPSTARPRRPRLVEEAMHWLPPPDAEPAVDEPVDDATRARILVADDNAELREYLMRLLGARWTVDAVPDGEAALAAMRRRRYDLVLTDVMMPRLDGYGLLRIVRADPLLKATPVVMLSALAGEDDCVEGLQHGADDYLVKPFTAREVVARVDAHLKLAARRQLAAENAALIRLHEVSMRLVTEDALPTLLQAVVDATVAVAEAGAGVLQLIDPAAQALRVVAQCGVDAALVERLADLDLPIPRNERVVVADVAQHAALAGTPLATMLQAAGVQSFQSTPILARDGRPLGMVSTGWLRPHRPDEGVLRIVDLLAREAADLIEHHDREHALRETQATLQSFYDTSPFMMGVVELDDDTPVTVYANAAATRYFGDDVAALDDRSAGQRRPSPTVRDLWIAQYGRSRREDGPVRFEYLHPGQGGERWLSATVAHVGVGRNGRPRFSFVIEEITERKRAERALLEADRRKDEFLAMLGHELRNPLLPIVTALKLIRWRGDDRFPKEHETIEQQVRHMVRLVDDLLDVARIARGTITLTKRTLSLQDVVAQAVKMALPLLDERRHALDVRVPDLPLDADEARLAQVVANLLTNAAKFTPHGGRIGVRAWRESGGVVLEVRDNGVGIAPDALPRVFDLFTQPRQGVGPDGAGLGLGLAIVRNLVALHGGSVEAMSDGIGCGSVFTVRLPECAGDAADLACAQHAALAATTRRQRVLVVDDNDAARDGIAELLRAVGHEVLTACDGVGGLAAAVAARPDVAILDIGLPLMDGYELARRMRAELGDAAPRLIALTGYGRELDRLRAVEAGFALHLTKPLVDRLVETIEAWGRDARADGSRD